MKEEKAYDKTSTKNRVTMNTSQDVGVQCEDDMLSSTPISKTKIFGVTQIKKKEKESKPILKQNILSVQFPEQFNFNLKPSNRLLARFAELRKNKLIQLQNDIKLMEERSFIQDHQQNEKSEQKPAK